MRIFKVSGMACTSCANAVVRAIQALDHTARVDVDLADGKVAVDARSDERALVAAIGAAGFSAISVGAGDPGPRL